MRSRNPVFGGRRSPFGPATAPPPSSQQLNDMYNSPAYGQQQPGYGQAGYGDPYARPGYAPPGGGLAGTRAMTLDDVLIKTTFTLLVLVAAGAAAWVLNLGIGVAVIAMIGALVLGLIASFKQSTNPALILSYAALEGVALGVISHIFNTAFNGIVTQAVLGTVFIFAVMLGLYSIRAIRVTPTFTKVVVGAAIAGVALMVVNMIVGIFVDGGIGIRTDSPLGWGFSIIMILVGAFFLALDFKQIEDGVRAGVPEKFAWQCAFGLTLTLVWIYLEVLRFLSYFASSD